MSYSLFNKLNLIKHLHQAVLALMLAIGLIGASIVVIPTNVSAISPGYTGKIYFHSNQTGNFDLYIMDMDGTNIKALTSHVGLDAEAVPSPDGTKIAFFSDRDGNNELYVMDSDGSNVTRLTNDSAADTGPTWSPDGTKIAFVSNRSGKNQILVMDSDGSNPVEVSQDPVGALMPDWSPDGSRIAYRSTQAGNDIYTVNADGTNKLQLTNGANFETNPYWTPDGQKILFARRMDATNYVIFSMDANGGNEVQLTSTGPSQGDFHPRMSPDGSKIVFTSARDGHRQLYLMNSDGSNQVRLTNHPSAIQEFPSWEVIPNLKPTANPDSLQVSVNSSGESMVLANDTDEESLDPTNLTIHTQPSHGTASIESGKVKYSPENNYVGADELTYQICDSFMLDQKCSTAVLGITVKPAAAISKVGDASAENGQAKYTTSLSRPTFSGTATPGSTVKVEIHSDPIILTTTADSEGNWSVTPEQDLPVGDHTVKITATLNGVTTELDSFVLAVQQTIPNTGFNSLPVRVGGGMLLIAGIGLMYWQRRKMKQLLSHSIPQLF